MRFRWWGFLSFRYPSCFQYHSYSSTQSHLLMPGMWGMWGSVVPTSSPFSCHSSLGLNCLRSGHYVLVRSKFQCCAAFVLPLFLDCVYSAITLGGLGGKIKVFNLLFSPRTNHCSLCANASVLQIKCWRSHECILINIYRIDNIKRDWKLGLVAYACYCNTW